MSAWLADWFEGSRWGEKKKRKAFLEIYTFSDVRFLRKDLRFVNRFIENTFVPAKRPNLVSSALLKTRVKDVD